MSTIKVDTIATRTGSGNITVSNNIAGGGTISGTNLSASGTLGVTGATTLSSNVAVNGGTGGQVATNFSSASTIVEPPGNVKVFVAFTEWSAAVIFCPCELT